MRARHLLLLSLLLGPAAAPLSAQSDSLRIDRLAALGRLYGVVKYFHPAFLERNVPWDSAVAATVERVNAAGGTDDYRNAIASLLAVLADPATRVGGTTQGAGGRAGSAPSLRWEVSGGDSTLVIAISDSDRDFDSAMGLLRSASDDLKRARRLVFDLRGAEPEELGTASYAFGPVQGLLPTHSISAPARRFRMHSGLAPQTGGTSGGYWSGTYEKTGAVITAKDGNPARRIVFLVTPGSDIPDVAFALRNAGEGAIVAEGATAQLLAEADVYDQPMGEGFTATVRLSAVVGPSDADTVVGPAMGAGVSDRAFQTALALASRPATAPLTAPVRPAYVPPPEDAYPGMRSPAVGYRLLAGYRYWNAIHYFYPYKHLLGEDWDNALPRSIRMLEAAGDSMELGKTLSAIVTWTHDSHSRVIRNPALFQIMGRMPAAVLVQYIGGRPAVVRIGDDSLTRGSGIAVGDVVIKVDGEDVAQRRARMAPFVAHSTPQALDDGIAQRLLGGNDSVAHLVLRGKDNRDREITLPRGMDLWRQVQYPRPGPAFRMLPGNIGYADLSLLTVAMVDSMFEVFKDTRGIIFDDRGYPQGTAWSIAPRLRAEPVAAAAFQRPLVTSPDPGQWTTFSFIQKTPRGSKWVYRGKTVLLVDERAISQSEHTAMFFEAVNHTTMVGSPTTGANGDVTNVALVSGMYATFTGHDVRHVDGRQLQRVGIKPDVLVRPTLAGVRAGRDEVLERAIALIK